MADRPTSSIKGLVIEFKKGDKVFIGKDITITLSEIRSLQKAKIRILAPDDVVITRGIFGEEKHKQLQKEREAELG